MKLNPYAREQLLVLSLSLAAIAMGAILAVAPFLAAASPALAVFPTWATVLWGTWFFVGGLSASYGILTMRRPAEAAGLSLQGSAFLATLVSSIVVYPTPLSLIFMTAITFGMFARASLLANREV